MAILLFEFLLLNTCTALFHKRLEYTDVKQHLKNIVFRLVCLYNENNTYKLSELMNKNTSKILSFERSKSGLCMVVTYFMHSLTGPQKWKWKELRCIWDVLINLKSWTLPLRSTLTLNVFNATCCIPAHANLTFSLKTSSSLSNFIATRGPVVAREHRLPHQSLLQRTDSQQHHTVEWGGGRAWKDASDVM